MKRMFILLSLALALVIPVSCEQPDGSGASVGGGDGPSNVVRMSGEELVSDAVSIDGSRVGTVELYGLDPHRLYALVFDAQDSRSLPSSSLFMRDAYSFFVIPDRNGNASISTGGLDSLLYALEEKPFTRPEDLVFIPDESRIIYHDGKGWPVYDAFFYINLEDHESYGIDDPGCMIMEVLRLGTGGGDSSTIAVSQSGPVAKSIDAYAGLDSFWIWYNLHREPDEGPVDKDHQLRYEVMLKTPVELKEGENLLSSPAYYIVPHSDSARLITISPDGEKNLGDGMNYPLHEVMSTSTDADKVGERRFFPIGYDESGSLQVYVAPGADDFWFPYYLVDGNDLLRRDDIGTITMEMLSDADGQKIAQEHFIMFDAASLEKGGKQEVPVEVDANGAFKVVIVEGEGEELRNIRVSADPLPGAIRVASFDADGSGYFCTSLHDDENVWNEGVEDPGLELAYLYTESWAAGYSTTLTFERP